VWECKCDCNKIAYVETNSLTRGSTKSCGCLNSELARKLGLSHRKYEPIISNARNIHQSTYSDIDFDLFYKLSQQNCYYCNRPPHRSYTNKANRKNIDSVFIYNGLDRLDSSKGHESNNVFPCCADCNTAKMSQSVDDFLSLIKRIYHHRCVSK